MSGCECACCVELNAPELCDRLVTEPEPETLGPSASFWSNVRTEPEAQPPGDGFQLSSEEREAVDALTAAVEKKNAWTVTVEHYHLRKALAALSRKERES